MTSPAFESTCRHCWKSTGSMWKPSVQGKSARESEQGGASRLHHPGRADAGDKRPRYAEAIDAGGPQPQRDHAFVLERGRHSRRSHSNWGARLSDQTFRENGAGRGHAEVPAEEAADHGESGAARLLRPGDRGFELAGGQSSDGADPPANTADRAGGCARFYLRGKRCGQGSSIANDPSALEAAQPAVW